MSKFILILIFITSQAFALSGKEAWINSNMKARVFLLNEYRAFFSDLHQREKLSDEIVRIKLISFLIPEAWAETGMDCFYAGWPSKRSGGFCSTPARHNPSYQRGSCREDELQCQPLLFGKNICVSVKTPQERSLAFKNCENKMSTSPEALIREIRSDGNEKALFDLMNLADQICASGLQKGTGMCSRLTAAVNKLRHFTGEDQLTITANTPESRAPAVVSKIKTRQIPKAPEKSSVQQELVQTVHTAAIAINKLYAKECEPETVGDPFDRDEPRPLDFEFLTSRPGDGDGWDRSFVKSKDENDLRYTGFEITNIGPNAIAGDALDPNEKSERKWRFISEDNSRRETYLWVTDDAGSGYISQLMESVIMLIPRKMKPKVETVGDDLHVTLTTGEKVIYDKKTKTIKAGALNEKKIDANPNRHARKFADISYSGVGISIRVNRRGEDPRLIQGNASITQGGKTCQIPARELWDTQSNFRYSDDQKLLSFLNKKCTNKFSY